MKKSEKRRRLPKYQVNNIFNLWEPLKCGIVNLNVSI
jgi:hypothetical protein